MSDDLELNIPYDEEPTKEKFSSRVGTLAGFLPRKLRIVITIVLITAAIITLLNVFKPTAPKRPIPETVVKVEVIEASRGNYPVIVSTNGTIQADTRGNMVSQIRGEIVNVSDNFKNGGSFKAGDVLIEVDRRDYQAEVSQAISAVSQAQANLEQEQALAKQAERDWKRLGKTGPTPILVARKPQMAAAKAQAESAKARYETAQLNLDRTSITAPYDGRVIQRNAVLGQYVSIGTNLAEIFSTDGVEVRLPVSQDEYTQLGLDQLYSDTAAPITVVINSQLGSQQYQWNAVVTRTDSTFDLTTRQIDVIAEVIDPFGKSGNTPPLKIGQFVNADIQGRVMENVITVPNKSLREGSYVFTAQGGTLTRTPITIAWQDDKNAVISAGLNEGDIVVTTSLNSTLAGAKVKFDDYSANSAADTPVVEDSDVIVEDSDFTVEDSTVSDDASSDATSTEQIIEDTITTESDGETTVESDADISIDSSLNATESASEPVAPTQELPQPESPTNEALDSAEQNAAPSPNVTSTSSAATH